MPVVMITPIALTSIRYQTYISFAVMYDIRIDLIAQLN